jgi:hypothetical protein
MGDDTKLKAGRPAGAGVPRSKPLTSTATPDEHKLVADAAAAARIPMAQLIRDASIAVASNVLKHTNGSAAKLASNFQSRNVIAKQPANNQSGNSRPAAVQKTANLNSCSGNVAEIPDLSDEIPQSKQPVATLARTRVSAPEDLRTKKELGDSSSLRSSQAAPVLEPDDTPWQEPQPARATIKISTGETINNVWLFANGCRLDKVDVDRILGTPSLKVFRVAMLKAFARAIRDTYRRMWCSAHNKRQNAWMDTPRSNAGFLKAAEYLAPEYAARGMTPTEFIEACNEMRPKSIKFVTSDLLGGAIGSRVAAWVPEEQRDRNKTWTAHVDNAGTTWITPAGEASPIQVIRTVEDRERLLRSNRVK